MRYTYLGDRWTAPHLCGMQCDPVRDKRGKCVVGGSKALVVAEDGRRCVVNRRRLRLNENGKCGA